MKKLEEQKEILQDVSELIFMLKNEVDLLRSITHRYYLEHGNKIKDGFLETPKHISFDVEKSNERVYCRILDNTQLGIESNYQHINELIKKLS